MRVRKAKYGEGEISYDKSASGDIAVYMDARRIGTIVNAETDNGYTYVSARGNYRGETFNTVREVMRSLETESGVVI